MAKKCKINIPPYFFQCATSIEMVFKILMDTIHPGFVQIIPVLYVLKSSTLVSRVFPIHTNRAFLTVLTNFGLPTLR
jgi:hypothetical protein